jgi:hypothetical protein
MPLTPGYSPVLVDTNRMTVLFTMMYGNKTIECEIKYFALDRLEGTMGAPAGERERQFERHRDLIERMASDVWDTANGVSLVSISVEHIRFA